MLPYIGTILRAVYAAESSKVCGGQPRYVMTSGVLEDIPIMQDWLGTVSEARYALKAWSFYVFPSDISIPENLVNMVASSVAPLVFAPGPMEGYYVLRMDPEASESTFEANVPHTTTTHLEDDFYMDEQEQMEADMDAGVDDDGMQSQSQPQLFDDENEEEFDEQAFMDNAMGQFMGNHGDDFADSASGDVAGESSAIMSEANCSNVLGTTLISTVEVSSVSGSSIATVAVSGSTSGVSDLTTAVSGIMTSVPLVSESTAASSTAAEILRVASIFSPRLPAGLATLSSSSFAFSSKSGAAGSSSSMPAMDATVNPMDAMTTSLVLVVATAITTSATTTSTGTATAADGVTAPIMSSVPVTAGVAAASSSSSSTSRKRTSSEPSIDTNAKDKKKAKSNPARGGKYADLRALFDKLQKKKD